MAKRTEFSDPNGRYSDDSKPVFNTEEIRVEGSFVKARVGVTFDDKVSVVRRGDWEFWDVDAARELAQSLLDAADFIEQYPSSSAAAMRRTIEKLKAGGVTVSVSHTGPLTPGQSLLRHGHGLFTQADIDALNKPEEQEQ